MGWKSEWGSSGRKKIVQNGIRPNENKKNIWWKSKKGKEVIRIKRWRRCN